MRTQRRLSDPMSSGTVNCYSVKCSLSGRCRKCMSHSDPSSEAIQCTHPSLSEEPLRGDQQAVDAIRSHDGFAASEASLLMGCCQLCPESLPSAA